DDVSELAPCGRRLLVSATASEYGQVLAQAADIWNRLIAGEVDAQQTLDVARGLHEVGMSWDASRLAAQAAAQARDRAAIRELVDYARDVNRNITAPKEFAATDDGGHVDTDTDSPLLARLTYREREVAALVVRGATYREIGAKLFISPKTVEHHVARIRRRIGSQTRGEMLEVLQPLGGSVLGRSGR